MKQSIATAKQAIADAQAQAAQMQAQQQSGQPEQAGPQSGNAFGVRPDGSYGPTPIPPPPQGPGQPGQVFSAQPYQPHQPLPGQSAPPTSRPHSASSPIDFDALGAGEPLTRQRRIRPVWAFSAFVMLVGGIGSLAYGIVDIVRTNSRAESSAVARGQIGETVQFTSIRAQAYTVYVVIDTSSSDTRDSIVNATSCGIRFADGGTASISGSRQVSSTNIGDTSSVGYFDAREGQVAVSCESRYSDQYEFFVSPGTNSIFSSLGFIFGGVGALLVGVVLLVVAFRRRRSRSSNTVTFTV